MTAPVLRNVERHTALLGSLICFRRNDCFTDVGGEVKELSSPNSSEVVESSVSL